MIEIYTDEIRMDEKVLRYATDEEIKALREIAGNIARRSRLRDQQMAESL
ncbi:MAG: hypothetical protein LIO81_07925 [Clostridiales bacterium]|nr:hypothetical protein [Clostridiales bacterium]